MTVYLLNSAVLTDFGEYEYREIGVQEAREILRNGFVSAIGHRGIAEFLTRILQLPVEYNRIEVKMQPGDIAVVYKIAGRLPSQQELNADDLEKIPYILGLLIRKR
ncbi:MAG: STIV orfB116 family protein [Nitrososphaeria archaeon]